MEFLQELFAWLKGISAKLPAINWEMYYIIVLAVIALVWVIVSLTLISSRSRRLTRACKKIKKYLAGVETIDDDNVSEFTTRCFGSKVPQPLRDAWMQYLGVRFGYPSEIVSDGAVYDKYVKKNKDVRSGVYLAVSLILLAVIAFWGYAILDSITMGIAHFFGLLLIAVTYLLLVIFHHQQNKHALNAFEDMQDDLDAKVNLQVENNYATDSSPLAELNSLVEEIIARNTAKVVDEVEATPIEELIEQAGEAPVEAVEEVVDEPTEEIEEPVEDIEEIQELEETEEPVEEPCEEPIEEVAEEPIEEIEESTEEAIEEPIEEVAEAEEPVAEAEETEEAIEEPQEEAEESVDEEPTADVDEAVEQEEPEDEEAPQAVEEPVEEDPEVVYVVDGEEEEEANVKPAKLAKLPNLVDYMLTKNMTRSMKIQLGMALIGAYKKFEHSKDDRKIVVQCLTKIVTSLQK